MKIDLDKDECEFIWRTCGFIACNPNCTREGAKDCLTALSLLKKLGDEWKDEGDA